MNRDSRRALIAEFLGTAFLLAAVVGSGIMGERLANGNAAVALLANSLATGAMLVVLILMFGPVSGAHFNPVVTLVFAFRKGTVVRGSLGYLLSQGMGALTGVVCANLMFELPAVSISTHARAGGAQFLSEFIATFGLVLVILMCAEYAKASIPYAVAGYITAAYWFTASTSFANPVVTLARALTNTFSGIRPADVVPFVVAQLFGGAFAAATFLLLVPSKKGPA
jgi:glycerol uptake facilitator-like aquaporin